MELTESEKALVIYALFSLIRVDEGEIKAACEATKEWIEADGDKGVEATYRLLEKLTGGKFTGEKLI
jgi:hypothetical protein